MPLDQQSLGGPSPPQTLFFESSDECGGIGTAECRSRARLHSVSSDPIDAAAVLSFVQRRRILLEIARRPLRMFDTGTVIVHDVEGAVGTDIQEHRPEPAVCRC